MAIQPRKEPLVVCCYLDNLERSLHQAHPKTSSIKLARKNRTNENKSQKLYVHCDNFLAAQHGHSEYDPEDDPEQEDMVYSSYFTVLDR